MQNKRVFLIVLDSFGIGALPDAKEYGDEGSNTLRSVASSHYFDIPTLASMGFYTMDGVVDILGDRAASHPTGSFARLAEASAGKDTTIGHWEIAGIISPSPLPTYPNGFPQEVIAEFEQKTGRGTLCNRPYSGTEVIKDYGQQQIDTGALIVYTSADSVFQVAAHEEYIPLEELYRCCQIARDMLQGEHCVGRVIARPYVGEHPNFVRTKNRRDFSLKPPEPTMLDKLQENGRDTIGIGKISDIFAGCGIGKSTPTSGNEDGMTKTMEQAQQDFNGLCFVNLVDFDMLYGHRKDIDGYARAMTAFDKQLQELLEHLQPEDILMITADHGCDPGFTGTDHTREYVPLLVYGKPVQAGVDLGTRSSLSDIAATVLQYFGMEYAPNSFLKQITK